MVENGRPGRTAADGGAEIVVENRPDESISRAILRGVAALKGVPEVGFEPLYESVEVDALESLVHHSRGRDCRVTVEFTFEGCTVRVRTDGTITISENRPPRFERSPDRPRRS